MDLPTNRPQGRELSGAKDVVMWVPEKIPRDDNGSQLLRFNSITEQATQVALPSTLASAGQASLLRQHLLDLAGQGDV